MKPLFGLLDANDPSFLPGPKDFGEFILDKGAIHDSTVLTDRYLRARPDCSKLYGWVQESPAILPGSYEDVMRWADDYDLFFTPCKGFEETYDNFRWAPSGGCWIPEQDRFPHEKTEMVSIVASGKNRTIGHSLRHKTVQAFQGTNLDVWGYGYKPCETKTEAMAPYRYSIVIENIRANGYFSEKLIDALIMGCIPIYWGDPLIDEVFDTDGFMLVNGVEQMLEAYAKCSKGHYAELAVSGVIEKNRLIAEQYVSVERNMWNAGLKDE